MVLRPASERPENPIPALRLAACVAVAGLVALTWSLPARAATFTVDTLVDENDGVGAGGVSLRDAINAANANGQDDVIVFGPEIAEEPGLADQAASGCCSQAGTDAGDLLPSMALAVLLLSGWRRRRDKRLR